MPKSPAREAFRDDCIAKLPSKAKLNLKNKQSIPPEGNNQLSVHFIWSWALPRHTYISSPSLCPCGLLLQRTSQQHRELRFQGNKMKVQAQNSITCNININHSIYTMTAGQHKSIVLFKACLIMWLLPCLVSCKRLWPFHEENKSTSQQQE